MKFITCPAFRGPIFGEHSNQAGVTLLRHAVNGWQVMLLAACTAKCEVKSRLPELWKESSVASADWRIPAGPRTLAPMTRELWLRGHRRNSLTSQRPQAALCAPPNIRGWTTHCPSNGDDTWSFFVRSRRFFRHILHGGDWPAFVLAYVPAWWQWRGADYSKDQIAPRVQLSDNDGRRFTKLILVSLKKESLWNWEKWKGKMS